MLATASMTLALLAQWPSASAPADSLPDVVARLKAVGVDIEGSRVKLESLSEKELLPRTADFAEVRLDATKTWRSMNEMRRALELQPAFEPPDKDFMVLTSGSDLRVFFETKSRSLLLWSPFWNSGLSRFRRDIRLQLAHQLVHAAQDLREPIEATIARVAATTDMRHVLEYLAEGEAEVAGMMALYPDTPPGFPGRRSDSIQEHIPWIQSPI